VLGCCLSRGQFGKFGKGGFGRSSSTEGRNYGEVGVLLYLLYR
jgi:hypothetical protein